MTRMRVESRNTNCVGLMKSMFRVIFLDCFNALLYLLNRNKRENKSHC